jgi:hypothetical protein
VGQTGSSYTAVYPCEFIAKRNIKVLLTKSPGDNRAYEIELGGRKIPDDANADEQGASFAY